MRCASEARRCGKTTLGEGPLWDVEQQRLYWIDSFDGRVFRCTADGREIRAWDVPGKIGSMALRKDGNGDLLGTVPRA
ncbi:MAG: SMP-30/gluconolactonase/LRE family protein [Dongiaceae bacterium]